jgi:modulator of drug activity B
MTMTDLPSDTQDATALSRRELIMAGSALSASMLLPAAAQAQTTAATATKRALVINAHQVYPGISEGRLNRSAAALIKEELERKDYETRETAIAAGYDIQQEAEKNLWADVIIVQSPAFWINTPYIYKKYVDEVFTSAMIAGTFLGGDGRPQGQYGSGGKMQGKKLMLSLTMNAPREAFNDPAQQLFGGRAVDDVFFSASAPYRFCGVEILPAFAFFDVMKNPDVLNDFIRLRKTLDTHFG